MDRPEIRAGMDIAASVVDRAGRVQPFAYVIRVDVETGMLLVIRHEAGLVPGRPRDNRRVVAITNADLRPFGE